MIRIPASKVSRSLHPASDRFPQLIKGDLFVVGLRGADRGVRG